MRILQYDYSIKETGCVRDVFTPCENIRITTIDSQGRASVRFQWTNSFSELVEQLLERFHTGVKIHRQTESCIEYTIGSWTKEIEVV